VDRCSDFGFGVVGIWIDPSLVVAKLMPLYMRGGWCEGGESQPGVKVNLLRELWETI
jgi:hypothetical protein